MVIRNVTKNTVLADGAVLAYTFLARLVGLLGRSSLPQGSGLVISPCTSIHTIGMRFPIDVVFYDRDRRALAVIRELPPYRLTRIYTNARGVIELPPGTLELTPVDVGDHLEMS